MLTEFRPPMSEIVESLELLNERSSSTEGYEGGDTFDLYFRTTRMALIGSPGTSYVFVFGNSFVGILSKFPIRILGVLLLFSGIELAMVARDMDNKEESFVMLVCATVSLTGSSAALGFGCGIVLFLVLKLRQMDCSSSVAGVFKSKHVDNAETADNP